MQWRSKKGGKWGHTPWAQVLVVHQHILQKNKIVFLIRNLDQNMPKNGLFLETKKEKKNNYKPPKRLGAEPTSKS